MLWLQFEPEGGPRCYDLLSMDRNLTDWAATTGARTWKTWATFNFSRAENDDWNNNTSELDGEDHEKNASTALESQYPNYDASRDHAYEDQAEPKP